jgi:hypothetical protein
MLKVTKGKRNKHTHTHTQRKKKEKKKKRKLQLTLYKIFEYEDGEFLELSQKPQNCLLPAQRRLDLQETHWNEKNIIFMHFRRTVMVYYHCLSKNILLYSPQ